MQERRERSDEDCVTRFCSRVSIRIGVCSAIKCTGKRKQVWCLDKVSWKSKSQTSNIVLGIVGGEGLVENVLEDFIAVVMVLEIS